MDTLQNSYYPQTCGDSVWSIIAVVILIFFFFLGLWAIYQSITHKIQLFSFVIGIIYVSLSIIGLSYPQYRWTMVKALLLVFVTIFVLGFILGLGLFFYYKNNPELLDKIMSPPPPDEIVTW